MKSFAYVAVAILMAATLRTAHPATPAVGDLAPDFELRDQTGKTVRLSAARGQKVVLVFYRGYW